MEVPSEHFVLKNPVKPSQTAIDENSLRSAVFATGCFWGSEKAFWRMPGVFSTSVGYIAGKAANPTYEQVCSGATGHTEAVLVYWDSRRLAFSDVMRMFLQSHDPTQGNRQGNDRGTQYRSGAYPSDVEDLKVTKAAIAKYEAQLGRKVTSEVIFPAPTFYWAEGYHQQYLAKPGARPYCSAEPTCVDLAPWSDWAPADLADAHRNSPRRSGSSTRPSRAA